MSPIIPILFATALGFGLGYKLKDCLCKKNKSFSQPSTRKMEHLEPKSDVSAPTGDTSSFSLHSIDHLFSKFNIPLTSDYSFSRLLDAIEKNSYISMLRHIDKEISSPKELFRFLEDEILNVTDFDIIPSEGTPHITQDIVNSLLENKNVDYTDLKTIEEKVKFLLMFAQGSGVKRFQGSFGNDLTIFLNKYKNQENTEIIFDGIKATIHNRLDFLS